MKTAPTGEQNLTGRNRKITGRTGARATRDGVPVWWKELLIWLGAGGGAATLFSFAYKLHKDAVDAHRERANDWKTAWERAMTVGDEKDQQLRTILKSLGQDRERT